MIQPPDLSLAERVTWSKLARRNVAHVWTLRHRLSGRLPAVRFVVFGRGRSGSTALMTLLDSVDGIHADDEILRTPLVAPWAHVDACARASGAECYGCKILSYQVARLPRSSQFLTGLVERGVRLIYLRRHNLLRHALSNLRARTHGFHQRGDAAPRRDFVVDPGEVVQWIEHSARLETYEIELLNGLPFLSLWYEDDLEYEASHQSTVDRVCAHLGVSSAPASTSLRRLTAPSLAETVTNAEELVKALRSTPYASFLDEASDRIPANGTRTMLD